MPVEKLILKHMLYKINKNGFIVNEANIKKIQPYYKKILKEIDRLYVDKLGDNLLSVYVRGSVSVGRAKFNISDIDSVAIIKRKLAKKDLLWIVKTANDLEKKYPKAGLVELTIISLKELLESTKYKNLRVYLKTQSICLRGKDILPQLPQIKPGKKLAICLYGNVSEELEILKKIFSNKRISRDYLFEKRPIKFWCMWMARTLLRAGSGLVMLQKPIYSQDLKTCFALFTEKYPEYTREMLQLLEWAVNPTNNRQQLFDFLDNFTPKFLKLWREVIK